MPGPAPVLGRIVPLAYVSSTDLSVPACSTPAPDGSWTACPAPLSRLPPGGVLVTIEPNLGFAEMVPPQVVTGPPDGRCEPLGADLEVWTVAAGAVVTACLRDPGAAAAAAAATTLMTTIVGRLDVNRFELGSATP